MQMRTRALVVIVVLSGVTCAATAKAQSTGQAVSSPGPAATVGVPTAAGTRDGPTNEYESGRGCPRGGGGHPRPTCLRDAFGDPPDYRVHTRRWR